MTFSKQKPNKNKHKKYKFYQFYQNSLQFIKQQIKQLYIVISSNLRNMQTFEQKLRNAHIKQIQNIMNRPINRNKTVRNKSNKNRFDSITTYMRKFEITKENLNLARRIHDCESSLSCTKYQEQWKKNKTFMKVRSQFKKNLATKQPTIYKYSNLKGYGNLFVEITLNEIIPQQNQLHYKNTYSLQIQTNSRKITPNENFFNIEDQGHKFTFYVPFYYKKRALKCKINQACENQLYQKCSFNIDLNNKSEQIVDLFNRGGKFCGRGQFQINIQNHRKRNLLLSEHHNGNWNNCIRNMSETSYQNYSIKENTIR